MIFFYDEVRKAYVRKGFQKTEKRVKITGWMARNTLW